MTAELTILLICQGLLLLFFVYTAWSMIFSAPYYPSRVKHLEEALSELNFELPPQSKFIDIGSGDGRFVRWAASQNYNATGIEANPFYSLWSRFRSLFSSQQAKQTYKNKNFNSQSFADYNVAYIYLFPELMSKLEPRLWTEMPPGSIIISNTFTFPNKKPIQEYKRIKIYQVE